MTNFNVLSCTIKNARHRRQTGEKKDKKKKKNNTTIMKFVLAVWRVVYHDTIENSHKLRS